MSQEKRRLSQTALSPPRGLREGSMFGIGDILSFYDIFCFGLFLSICNVIVIVIQNIFAFSFEYHYTLLVISIPIYHFINSFITPELIKIKVNRNIQICIKNCYKMQTQSQLLEQHETIQNYIATLFDSLPKIKTQDTGLGEQVNLVCLLEQNVEYGRKIIELAEKFTAKYRKDHFVDRKDVEEKIISIFRHICPHTYSTSLDEMVTLILRKIEENPNSNAGMQSRSSYGHQNYLNPNSRANSINHLYNFNTKDSKVQFYRDQAEEGFHRLQSSDPLRVNHAPSHKQLEKLMRKSKVSVENMPLQPSETDLNDQASRKRSINKSKVSKKGGSRQKEQDSNFTTKNALQIKVFFQQEENCLRKLFEKINKIISQSGNGKNSIKISQENSEYTKCVNEAEKDNIKEFVQANIQNTKHNIQKIGDFIDVLAEFYDKKSKLEGFAQGKFGIYITQINKREEVFSFTVSKLLENLNILRSSVGRGQSQRVQQEENDPIQIIEKLEEISQGFYDLYPSHSILKDLKINLNEINMPSSSKELQKIGYKNEGVQVSFTTGKNQKLIQKEVADSKRNMLQLFKTSARVNQMIQKFERSMKYKKNIEPKQVQKFIQTIRDSFPKKGSFSANIAVQATSYHEQLKRIVENNQRNQKEMSEDFNKKVKKYEKQVQDLQKMIDEIMQERKKQIEKVQTTNRKISKKLETEKDEVKKIQAQKLSLEKNIKQMSSDISRLQRELNDQNQKFQLSQKMLMNENKQLQTELHKANQSLKKITDTCKEQTKKMQQERQIYQQKIIFLESHEETRNEQLTQVKEELEEMIKENTVLKKQVEQLTELYEQKIKQLEELIDNIKELQDELKQKNLHNLELQEKLKIFEEKCAGLEKEKGRLTKQIGKIEQKLKEKQTEASKYRQLGVLNQSDIGILKQQMQKVKQAYIESDEQLQQLRQYVQRLESEKQFMARENRNYRKEVQSYNEKWQGYQLTHQKLQKQVREFSDDAVIRKRELNIASQQLQEAKKQIVRLKKEIQQQRDSNLKLEGQIRVTRQETQKKSQVQSLESGKRRLELQAAKVELRRKTEQLQKMKQTYEQKIEMLESKNKELSQFITQKQLLAKITNSHLSQ